MTKKKISTSVLDAETAEAAPQPSVKKVARKKSAAPAKKTVAAKKSATTKKKVAKKKVAKKGAAETTAAGDAGKATITSQARQDLIGKAAYFISQKRPPHQGDSHTDWLCAEAVIDMLYDVVD